MSFNDSIINQSLLLDSDMGEFLTTFYLLIVDSGKKEHTPYSTLLRYTQWDPRPFSQENETRESVSWSQDHTDHDKSRRTGEEDYSFQQ